MPVPSSPRCVDVTHNFKTLAPRAQNEAERTVVPFHRNFSDSKWPEVKFELASRELIQETEQTTCSMKKRI